MLKMFFVPSGEIATNLIQRVSKRRAGNLRAALAETTEEGELEESDELLSSVLAALEDGNNDSAESNWQDRRWLGEIIYHFMGRLARQSRREASNHFGIEKCIVEGMGVRLGLRQAEDAELLKELAYEFSEWLSLQQDRSFIAGWGKIVGDSYDPDALMFRPLEMSAVRGSRDIESNVRAVEATASSKTARAVEVDQDLVEY